MIKNQTIEFTASPSIPNNALWDILSTNRKAKPEGSFSPTIMEQYVHKYLFHLLNVLVYMYTVVLSLGGSVHIQMSAINQHDYPREEIRRP
jgi:hypothetical protein